MDLSAGTACLGICMWPSVVMCPHCYDCVKSMVGWDCRCEPKGTEGCIPECGIVPEGSN